MTPPGASVSAALTDRARESGFDLAGIASLGPASTAAAYDQWLADGHDGTMHYMREHADIRRDSRRPEPGMHSALVVALNYGGTTPPGPVARYARGDDYHRTMWDMLEALGDWLVQTAGGKTRAFVDTAPILERDLARRAGLGWFGKNSMLINPELGSFFFIGALFTSLELEPQAPFATDHCGTCTRCLDACPTSALVEPGVLDATKCISYLTIELRSAIPETLREGVGDHLYGCDVCQDVCPWNEKFSRPSQVAAFAARAGLAGTGARELAIELLALDEPGWRERFRNSAIKRAKYAGLRRNAATVLGNVGQGADAALLRGIAAQDGDAVVREHAAWAAARLAQPGRA